VRLASAGIAVLCLKQGDWVDARAGGQKGGGGRCRERRFRRLGLYAAYAPIAWAETEIRRMFEKK